MENLELGAKLFLNHIAVALSEFLIHYEGKIIKYIEH